MSPLPLTVSTAGHIDHGKTVLVRALTGRDTDRLPEERRRGMSIELGFADLDLGDRRLSLVDVPGHERFVRTMIAGASGVDMFLLVVAADDGPMPQTLEHLKVLRALGIEHGVLALSKVDLVGDETRRLAAEGAVALAQDLPLVEVSSRTGEGLEELRTTMAEVADAVEARRQDRGAGANGQQPVLHVDRVFTITGHGTVVTGTLWSGQLQRGQRVTLLPEEREARVRSIEVHGQPLEIADSHQRVALNLTGIARDEVQRGDVVTIPGADIHISYRLDVELTTGSAEILTERRVQVYLGTRETPARVAGLGGNSAQLRLERPMLTREGDRVVVRRTSPPDTLGGGIVIHPSPPRHGPGWSPKTVAPEREQTDKTAVNVASPTPGALARRLLTALRDDGSRPRSPAALAKDLGEDPREIERALGELIATNEAVRVRRNVIYPINEYRRLSTVVLTEANRSGSISLAEARDLLGIGRRYAQALLEHLNMTRELHRDGDRHLPAS